MLKSCELSMDTCMSFGLGDNASGIFIFFLIFGLTSIALLIILSVFFINAAREQWLVEHEQDEPTQKALLALFANPQLNYSQACAQLRLQ